MNPDDEKELIDITADSWLSGIDYSESDDVSVDYSVKYANQRIAASDTSINWTSPFTTYGDYSTTMLGVDPQICLSDKQAEAHEKFPALKEAWDIYQSMYMMVKNKEPGDEIL